MDESNDGRRRVSSSSTSSSSSSSAGENDDYENNNEIPRGRKVPSDTDGESIRLIRPSRTEQISLPAFTVGQPDTEDKGSTTPRVSFVAETSTKKTSSSSSSRSSGGNGRPVFQKSVPTEKPPTTRSTERIRALGYSQQKNSRKQSQQPDRAHRAFSGFDMKLNDVDADLASAASTGRATVTYVGFADFTTTVGNTVIVFMPRTKMIEDMSLNVAPSSISSTLDATQIVKPTRFAYTTEGQRKGRGNKRNI